MFGAEALGGIDRAQHLAQVGADAVEVEVDLVAVADEAMMTDCETVPIDLKPMSEPRLHDALAFGHFVDQAMYVIDVIVADTAEVGRNHRTQQQPAEAGDGVAGVF